MNRIVLVSIAVASFAMSSATYGQGIINNDGLFRVQVLASQSGTQPGTSTANWLNIWNTNPTGTGTIAGFNITHNEIDTEVSFDYPNGGGDFGVNRGLNTINGDGPGGGGGSFGPGGDNYSVRAQTFIQFTAGGTYTIAMGSDDGTRISLTEALPGAAPGYTGFTARPDIGGQDDVNGAFTPGDTVIGFDGGRGHQQTLGTFTVAAGDILALDTFYYEGGGGDSGEISLAQGTHTDFNGSFALLTDNMFNGTIQLGTGIQAVPEPMSIVLWSLGGLLGFAALRTRRRVTK